MVRFVSFLVLVAILVVIAIIFFQVMAGFFVPLFMAALFGVVVQPLFRWTLAKCRGYRYVAAGITTTLVALIVLLPIGLVLTTATLEGISLIDKLQLSKVQKSLDELRVQLGLQFPRERDVRHIEVTLRSWREKQRKGEPLDLKPEQVENLQQRVTEIETWLAQPEAGARTADLRPLYEALIQLHASAPDSIERDEALADADAEFREFKRNLLGGTYRAWLTEWANPSDEQIEQLRRSMITAAGPVLSLGGDTLVLLAKLVFGTLIMVVTLFFLLGEGSRLLDGLIKLLPLEESHVRELASEFDRACRAIVSATLLSALAQGLLAGLGFYVCGLRDSVALLTVMTMVLALVPFTGAAAVWIPVTLYLFYEGSMGWAIFLGIYGTIVISGADNIIKPLVLHGQSNLHPLLALLSVLGGIQALGPIGIVVGPMAVVFLQVLLRLVQRELSSMDRTSWTFWRGFGGAEPGAVAAAVGPTVTGEAAAATSAAPAAPSASSAPAPPPGNGRAGGGTSGQQPQRRGKKHRR